VRPLAVVDTNVPIVASGRSHAGKRCRIRCAHRISDVMQGGCIVIDDQWEIVQEYKANLNQTGQPAIGDRFLRWVLTNLANREKCLRVALPRRADDPEAYIHFPDDPDLAQFDPSDRKFVAVALASGLSPPILNAVDPDWWEHREALGRHGVVIEFLCPEELDGRSHS
jgi:hypothetical protein